MYDGAGLRLVDGSSIRFDLKQGAWIIEAHASPEYAGLTFTRVAAALPCSLSNQDYQPQSNSVTSIRI